MKSSVGAIRVASGLLVTVLGSAAVGCSTRADAPASTPPIVGTWVQVYPKVGALDTVKFGMDSSLSGSTMHVATPLPSAGHWKIDAPVDPDQLCLGGDSLGARPPHWVCQAYRLNGDTLWLANGSETTFLRLHPNDSVPIGEWQKPHGSPSATAQGVDAKVAHDSKSQ